MGATAAIGWQFTETDFPRAFAQGRQARQVVFDPLPDAVLNGLRIDFLRRISGFELNPALVRPVVRLDRHPAHGLDEVADQMSGRVHAGVEASAFFIDTDLGHAQWHRLIDEMNDPVRILNNPQDPG